MRTASRKIQWFTWKFLSVLLIALAAMGCGDNDTTLNNNDLSVDGMPSTNDARPDPDTSLQDAGPRHEGQTPKKEGGIANPDVTVTLPDIGKPDQSTAPGKPPGSTCTCDSDCQDVTGHEGICVYGVCMTRAADDCSSPGSTIECPSGSRCWGLKTQPGSICWPNCAGITCAGNCDADGSCMPGAGMDCDPSCASYCSSVTPPPPRGKVGAPCTTNTDCDNNGICIDEGNGNGWVDGYCVLWDCATAGAACGDGGVCIAGMGTNGENVCLKDCTSGCRDGYACVSFQSGGPTLCWPYCDSSVPCPTGYQCQNNKCIPGSPCSTSAPDGFCPIGQTCISGNCQDNCSPTHPAGYCPPGFACVSDSCQSVTGCGTWECTLGYSDCHQLVRMPGADQSDFYNPSTAAAQAAGYYIATNQKYTYLRRDLTMLIQWATCEMRQRFSGVAPIGLADLSQADGKTPGEDVGSPRHPTSTHTGSDFDTGYFQTDGSNNPQIICGDGSDNNSNGVPGTYNDGYKCTTTSNIVNVDQELWWFVYLAHNPDWRVVGIDTTLFSSFQAKANSLHSSGEIDDVIYNRIINMGHESQNGWDFHHHHTHFSFN